MSHHRFMAQTVRGMNRLLALVLGVLVALSSVCAAPALANTSDGQTETMAQNVSGRVEENFNRNWKFIRKDVPDQEAISSAYSDDHWYNVGLPHDFSIPYYQETSHYTGIGWYRKKFDLRADQIGKCVKLDFEGVFHTIDLYINGEHAGHHEGGYTGFEFDITKYVHEGENVLAAKVSNIWNPELAPRAGEHMFTGGIYRDVTLVTLDPVHVAWYGTFVQTPNVSKEFSDLRIQTEVDNTDGSAHEISLRHTLLDADGVKQLEIESETKSAAPAETIEFDDTYTGISNPHLWSVDDPYLYTVKTEVYRDGVQCDEYSTTMGFRWCEWTSDGGFYLNGEHVWINGTNAHQDHAGWANAVSDSALRRDVEMIKEAGMNFIRGSHYPHSPVYSDACDELGLLFWSEAPYWTTYGFGEGSGESSNDYMSGGYPTEVEHQEAFEQSCLKSVEDMIRIHRNHPSIVIWSMGNEPFFGDDKDDSGADLNVKKKKMISRMAKYAKELDPTRAVAMGGTQRGGYDKLEYVDVAGYNGDGAKINAYQDPGVANIVSEYGSHTAQRGQSNDQYRAYFGDVQLDENGLPIEYAWRSGVVLWCMFHHGSTASRGYGDMGIVDYYRLPHKAWYWYRNKYNPNHPEPEFSKEGTPVKVELSASSPTLSDDGQNDTHIIATLVDEQGNWIGDKRKITLRVLSGPGVFPTGKTFVFDPDNANRSMNDGKGAIEFRSHYAGTTIIEAQSEGLESSTITLVTTGDSIDETEPDIHTMYGSFMNEGGKILTDLKEAPHIEKRNLAGIPCKSSSNEADRLNILDGDAHTEWRAEQPGSDQWISMELEHGGVNLYRAALHFNGEAVPYTLQYQVEDRNEEWKTLVSYDAKTIQDRPKEEVFDGVQMRYVRVLFDHLDDSQFANLAELELYGLKGEPDKIKTGYQNLSDLELPEGAGKKRNADGSRFMIDGVFYDQGIGMSGDMSMNISNFTSENGGYARFETLAYNPSKSPVRLVLSAKEQTIYDRTLQPGESDQISTTIWNCPALTIQTEGSADAKLSLIKARLTGIRRDLVKNKNLQIAYYANYDTIVPGTLWQAWLETEIKQDKPVMISAGVYDAKGALLSMYSKETEGTSEVISVSLPITEEADSIRLFAWDGESLALLSQTAIVEMIDDREKDKYAGETHDDGHYQVPQVTKTITGREMNKTGAWDYWTPANGSIAGEETFVETHNWQNSSMDTTFTGTRVKVFAKKDGSQHGAKVLIDGKEITEISTYVPQGEKQGYMCVFDSGILEEGEHSIELIPTGKFGFDALEITASGITPPVESDENRYDSTEEFTGKDEALEKNGTWGYWNTGSLECGYETFTDNAGDILTLEFTGTGVSMIAKFDGSKSGAEVYIDDKLMQTISTNASPDAYREAFSIQDLSFQKHTLKIVTTGKFGFEKISVNYGHPEDRGALLAALEEAEKLDADDYSSESWTLFESTRNEAALIAKSFAYSQKEIDEITARLVHAQSELKSKALLDCTALAAKVHEAMDLLEEQTYDPQSAHKGELKEILLAASQDFAQNSTQILVDAHASALEDLLPLLRAKNVNVSLLEFVIGYARTLAQVEFKADGFALMQDKLNEAKSVLDQPDDQESVDQASVNLNRALLGMRRIPSAEWLEENR